MVNFKKEVKNERLSKEVFELFGKILGKNQKVCL
jgi:hypothetical protein